MALETTLVDCTGVIVALLHMSLQLFIGKQFMLVGEHFLVSCAEVAHLLMMYTSDMSMQVRPTQTCNIAAWVRAVVPQE
jgi:hypothetical protein